MLTWLVVMSFVTVTALAAGRLLLLARETRGLPEVLIATLILGVGTFGVGGSFVITTTVPEGALRTVLGFLPIISIHIGMAALSVFTWRVYRPESPIARSAACALVLALAGFVGWAALAGTADVLATRELTIWTSTIYVFTMMWSAVEAMIYWRAMRRRLTLGLADPIVTNRFLLWGLATGVAGQGIAIGAVGRLVLGIDPNAVGWIMPSYAAHGSFAAICFWLAFKPPAFYARRLERSVSST